MLRALNMARICCPVGSSEKNCFFPNEKGLKLIPKITISQFVLFSCIYCQFFDRHGELEC